MNSVFESSLRHSTQSRTRRSVLFESSGSRRKKAHRKAGKNKLQARRVLDNCGTRSTSQSLKKTARYWASANTYATQKGHCV